MGVVYETGEIYLDKPLKRTNRNHRLIYFFKSDTNLFSAHCAQITGDQICTELMTSPVSI